MNETYIVVGAHWGTFTAKDTGEVRGYAVLFCKAPFKESREGGNYHSMGEKTFQFKRVTNWRFYYDPYVFSKGLSKMQILPLVSYMV